MCVYVCAEASYGDALFWLLIILLLVIGLFIGVGFIRRYFHSSTPAEVESTFSLGDLRKMLRDGRLSQEEFDRLKSQIITTLKKGSDLPPGASEPRPPDHKR